MIARGVQHATKGGLHDNDMTTSMTIHHTTISHSKEGKKRWLWEEVDDNCGRMTDSC